MNMSIFLSTKNKVWESAVHKMTEGKKKEHYLHYSLDLQWFRFLFLKCGLILNNEREITYTFSLGFAAYTACRYGLESHIFQMCKIRSECRPWEIIKLVAHSDISCASTESSTAL